MLNSVKFGQNPKPILFYKYDVLFRTPSLLFRAYLVHFVRQFLCFQTKHLVLVIKGLFDTSFHSVLMLSIQNHSNASRSKTFYKVYSISYGLLTNISVLIQNYFNVSGSYFDLQVYKQWLWPFCF